MSSLTCPSCLKYRSPFLIHAQRTEAYKGSRLFFLDPAHCAEAEGPMLHVTFCEDRMGMNGKWWDAGT